MTWRAPNRLRRELGVRPEPGAIDVLLFCAVAFVIAAAASLLLWWLGAVYISKAGAAMLYPVPAECAALAQRYGLPDALTLEQAQQAKAKLDRHRIWPGVRICRAAVIREWKL